MSLHKENTINMLLYTKQDVRARTGYGFSTILAEINAFILHSGAIATTTYTVVSRANAHSWVIKCQCTEFQGFTIAASIQT